MERSTIIKQLQIIISKMAEKLGYSNMTVNNVPECGIWGPDFVRFLEKRVNGDCTTSIRWTAADNEYNYAEFRFRFSNPVIAVRYKNANEENVLASLEFTNTKYVRDGEYEEDSYIMKKGDPKYKPVEIPWKLSEIIIWNYDEANPLLLEMKGMFDEFMAANE